MWQDPIVAEVRRAREAHAAQYKFDLEAIYHALKTREEQSQHEKITFAPRRVLPIVVKEMNPAWVEMRPALAI